MPAIINRGISTIVWGTANANAGAPAGAIVVSASIKPKNGEPFEIEDGQGFAADLIILDDGFNATISCVDDSAKAWPAVGGNVALTLPGRTGNANANAQTYVCLVLPYTPTQERKKEGMVDIGLVYRPGVSV